jgi:hypothetical protein
MVASSPWVVQGVRRRHRRTGANNYPPWAMRGTSRWGQVLQMREEAVAHAPADVERSAVARVNVDVDA